MAIRALVTNGTLSTGTWKRAEAGTWGAVMTAANYDDTNTLRFLPVTFANAGNQVGLFLAHHVPAVSGTFTVYLEENKGNATISQATPGVVTLNSHSLADNSTVTLATTGALPAPLATTTTYYVRNGGANTFELSLTSGGASINTTNAGSGTHTVWADRTTDATTVDRTNYPGLLTCKYYALTSYAVTNAASTWRYAFKASVAARINLWRTASAGAYTYAAFLDQSAATPTTATDAILVADNCTLTVGANFTLTAQDGRGMILCNGATLSCENPASASWTLTVPASTTIFKDSSSHIKFGTALNAIAAANRFILDVSACTNGWLESSSDYLMGGTVAATGSLELYGAEDSYLACSVASLALVNQKNIVLTADMSATWANSDVICIVGKDKTGGAGDGGTYTIASMSGTTITLNVNLDYRVFAGARVVNLSRSTNLGIYIKGHASNAIFFFNRFYLDHVISCGVYWENAGVCSGVSGGYFYKDLFSTTADTFRSCLTKTIARGWVTYYSNYANVSNCHQYTTTTALYGFWLQITGNNGTFSNITAKNGNAAAGSVGSINVIGNGVTVSNMVVAGQAATAGDSACQFSGNNLTLSSSYVFGGSYAAKLFVNDSTITSLTVDSGGVYNLYLGPSSSVNFITCNIGQLTAAGTKDISYATGNPVTAWFYGCNLGVVDSLINQTATSRIYDYNDSGHHVTYTPGGYYEKQALVVDTLKYAAKCTPTSATTALTAHTTVKCYSGQLLTVTARFRKNAAYGSTSRPYMKLSGKGAVTDTQTMPDNVDTWNTVTCTGTPTSNGYIDIEIGGWMLAGGALYYFDDICPTISPSATGTMETWYKGDIPSLAITTIIYALGAWTADPLVSADEATALARTGISLNTTTNAIAITTAYTAAQVYEYIKAKCRDLEVPNIYWTSVDGLNWNVIGDVTVTGVALTGSASSLNLATKTLLLTTGASTTLQIFGGTLQLDTPDTINTPLGTCTVDLVAAGTYDFRSAVISGTVTFTTSNDSDCTVQVAPGTDYVNGTPAHITIESSTAVTIVVNNIVDGSRIQVYDTDNDVELKNAEVSGTTSSTNFTYTIDTAIRIRLTRINGTAEAYKWYEVTGTIGVAGFSMNAAQQVDQVYIDNNTDGSTVTECSVSGTTIRIYVDDPDNTTTAQRIYNWYAYYLTTEAGIREQDGDYVTAVDQTHYTFANTMKIINSDTTNPLNITGANITPVSGAATNIFDLTNGASLALNFNRVEGFPYSTGSGLSSAEHTMLETIEGLVDVAVSSRLALAGYTVPPTVGQIDTQLTASHGSGSWAPGTIPTAADIADAVLDEAAAGHTGMLTLIYKILKNKTITDPATGAMTVYDDDDTAVLFTANIFQDAAGVTPYADKGADRRERLV
jgi:hypothetical protein